MTVLSIDLASRNYSDIGIAVLSSREGCIEVPLIQPADCHLFGVPSADRVAELCLEVANDASPSLF
jgi:hypothetical protein